MPQKTGNADPPRGVSRLLWRAPIWFYRLRLGWLFRNRMLLLHHVGRTSGLPRETMLEVADYEEPTQ
jgi:hypothetical protein